MRPDAISIVLFAYTVFYLDSTRGFWPAANSILDIHEVIGYSRGRILARFKHRHIFAPRIGNNVTPLVVAAETLEPLIINPQFNGKNRLSQTFTNPALVKEALSSAGVNPPQVRDHAVAMAMFVAMAGNRLLRTMVVGCVLQKICNKQPATWSQCAIKHA